MLVTAYNDAPARARWQVLWIDGKRIVREEFGHDLLLAVKRYAELAGKHRGVTLRCKNFAFPPPDKYADREVVVVRVGGKRKRGLRILQPLQYQSRMLSLNRRGIWWCPYCCELRKFVRHGSFKSHGQWVGEEAMCCPMCGATHRDFSVRRYNPLSVVIEMAPRNGVAQADPNQTTDAKRERARERRRARAAKRATA